MDYLKQSLNQKRSAFAPSKQVAMNFKITPQIKQRLSKSKSYLSSLILLLKEQRMSREILRSRQQEEISSEYQTDSQMRFMSPFIQSQKSLARPDSAYHKNTPIKPTHSVFMSQVKDQSQQQFENKIYGIDPYSQSYSLFDVQKRIVKCFSQKQFKVSPEQIKKQIMTQQQSTRPQTSNQSTGHLKFSRNLSRVDLKSSNLKSRLHTEQMVFNRNIIGTSIKKDESKDDSLEQIKAQPLTLEEELDLELKTKLKKQREKLGKVDLSKISVPDALKLLQEKRALLFSDKTKKFSLELERMILSIDENQLINYIRDEINKKDSLNDPLKVALPSEIVNKEIYQLQDQNKRIAFNLSQGINLKDEQVKFTTENDVYDELFNKAIKERRQVTKEPFVRVRQIFKDQNLIKDDDDLKSNVLMMKLKRRFKNKIFECAKQLQDMNMDMKQFVQNHVMPTRPYERPGSQKFIHSVKNGEKDVIIKMLKSNKFFVYDYDNIQQTALHWAAKRNHPDICNMLLESGANVNAIDIGGRTPLYIATKENNFECVKALLAAQAIPLLKTNSNKTAFDVAKDAIVERYLTKAQLLYICLKLIPIRKRKLVWEQEGLYYFKGEGEKIDV